MLVMTTSLSAGRVPAWTLADRLRKARETTGMSQAELAERMGVARSTVARSEQTGSARRQTLLTWAFATGVDLGWLETGEAPSPDGDGAGVGSELPRLDSNQQPFDCSVITLRPAG